MYIVALARTVIIVQERHVYIMNYSPKASDSQCRIFLTENPLCLTARTP